MIKFQKSHISTSSTDSNNNTINYFYDNINNKSLNSKNKTKQSINNYDIEKDLKKLILISLKNKKFLEKNDYFFSNSIKKKNTKKIKLKLTPFQVYEKFKQFSLQKKLNNTIINSYRLNDFSTKNEINNLFTTKNLKKNKTYLSKFCLTNYHPIYKNRNLKTKNNTKIFISSIDNNKNDIFKSFESKKEYKKILYINDFNDNNVNKTIKVHKSNNKYKSIFQNIIHKNKKNLSIDEKGKRSIGVLASTISTNRIVSLKSKNKIKFGLPKIKNEKSQYQIPLIYMNESKFRNKIISNNN